ncbi:DUF7064 domain-containing protein [Mycolicibacterium septicum]|uniref:DUF7064 domain-containing protein n=1 Tax=Mycolicibacterium septicum TaxID=98668 RepID=UPI00235E492C|nr:hypothetical protein [Mycolicibacterium septicum]
MSTFLTATDDLRHRPAPGKRMRDSLFWEVIVPEEDLGLQIYLYLTGSGRAGYNVVLWGSDTASNRIVLGSGRVPDSVDLDHLDFDGLTVRQPEPLHTCSVSFHRDDLAVEFEFTGLHEAFSYHRNPDGLPRWFAENRLEQTGGVRGSIVSGARCIELDHIGHRDHSWGLRDWNIPQHWKWFVAYTPDGDAVNGWIWIAQGQWGFAGYVARDGVTTPIANIDHHADYDPQMNQQRLTATVTDTAGGRTEVVLEAFGVVELPSHDPMATVIREAACRGTIDGRPAAGQFETHWVGSYLEQLVSAATR